MINATSVQNVVPTTLTYIIPHERFPQYAIGKQHIGQNVKITRMFGTSETKRTATTVQLAYIVRAVARPRRRTG